MGAGASGQTPVAVQQPVTSLPWHMSHGLMTHGHDMPAESRNGIG